MRGFCAIMILVGASFSIAVSSSAGEKPQPSVKPVTVRVFDSWTHLPITNFAYSYWIVTAGTNRTAHGERIRVEPTNGEFVLPAPRSCKITIEAVPADYVSGYGTSQRFEIRSDDGERKVQVSLERGLTVRGTVRDKRTKLPIAGATVSPLIFTPPAVTEDEEKSVKTDKQGRYEVRGVSLQGVQFSDPDYATAEIGSESLTNHLAAIITRDVLLEPAEIVKGIVVDPSGRPLANAEVEDYGGKSAVTGMDGRFVIKGAVRQPPDDDDVSALAKLFNVHGGNLLGRFSPRAPFSLRFSKDGYINKDIEPNSIPNKGFRVVLEPCFELEGRVMDLEGRPVTNFTAYFDPGSSWQGVSNLAGLFSIKFSKAGTNYIAVAAPGCAAWGGPVIISRTNAGLEIRLPIGTTVIGMVQRAQPGTSVSLNLVGSPYRGFATERAAERQTTVEPSGRFEFQHVGGDRYELYVSGPRITPTNFSITVSNEVCDVGVISLAGVGNIKGRAFQAAETGGGSWAFADGVVRRSGRVVKEFKTDEDGLFTVQDVPTGELEVGFRFPASADLITEKGVKVNVLEGETAEVTFRP